jgi:hypothetical protein
MAATMEPSGEPVKSLPIRPDFGHEVRPTGPWLIILKVLGLID